MENKIKNYVEKQNKDFKDRFKEIIFEMFEVGLDEDDVFDIEEEALKEVKSSEDRCSNCGALISDEDFIVEENHVPYGDTYAVENIIVGYECSKCGFRGE